MSTELEVRPHEGIGPLRLGWTRARCREALPLGDEHLKTGDDRRTGDVFVEALHVFYDEDDRVEYLEVSTGWDATPVFDGVRLLEVPAEEAVRAVERHAPFDPDHWELGWTYQFPSLELALWRPTLPEGDDDPDGRCFSTVGVGVRGYFSSGG